ncbi:MAG: hypothetical protein M3A44_15075 [Gammaproteobacteria bacterium]
MFICGEVLDWNYYSDNGSGLSDDEEERIVGRAHDIWRHASSLISPGSSEFSLADAITGLKRAVNHRLKALSNAYSFDALPFLNQKKTLEKFQFYGIIRPALLKELFEIRNSIEHMDRAPPSVDECRRYVDFVWYFLKSTDSLLTMKLDDVIFWCDSENRSLRFCPEFDGSWNIKVSGEVLVADILECWQPGALELVELDESCERPDYIRARIYGRWQPSPDQLSSFARKYFDLSGYWEDHA